MKLKIPAALNQSFVSSYKHLNKKILGQNIRYHHINSSINRHHIECDVTMNDISVYEDVQSLSVRPSFFSDEFQMVLKPPLTSNERPSCSPSP